MQWSLEEDGDTFVFRLIAGCHLIHSDFQIFIREQSLKNSDIERDKSYSDNTVSRAHCFQLGNVSILLLNL